MHRLLTTFMTLIMIIINVVPVDASEPAMTPYPLLVSEAAVLMDARTGQVMFEKNMDEQLHPASITKIMTVLLGIENSAPRETITMSREAIFSISRGASHIALDVGEQISMEQALMAAMLPSANEACNGIAEHVSGSMPEFVQLMNERAVEAGALHTNFTNANGLCEDEHLTTAFDMAMITRMALMNEQFRQIFGTPKYEIPPTNMQSEPRYLWAEHKMFPGGRYEYEGVIGGKTGYTQKSQNTLVTVAQRGDRELIAVVIKSPNGGVYVDTKALFDYGFNEFNEQLITLPAVTGDNLSGSDQDWQSLQAGINQLNDVGYTRLLHKDIDINDIMVNYLVVPAPDKEKIQLNMNMSLKKPTDLMYAQLGTISLDLNILPATGLVDKTINVLRKIIIIFIVAVIAILSLRWFFKKRNYIRYKSSYIYKR